MRTGTAINLDAIRETNKNRFKQEQLAKKHPIEVDVYENNSEIKIELMKAIRRLSNAHQTVVKLFYVEEYSLKEIADLLGISTGTVKSRLFHARENLKLILKKQEL